MLIRLQRYHHGLLKYGATNSVISTRVYGSLHCWFGAAARLFWRLTRFQMQEPLIPPHNCAF